MTEHTPRVRLRECPMCHGFMARVVESRMQGYGRRQRIHCSGCGYRWTERQLNGSVSVTPPAPPETTVDRSCLDCVHEVREECTLQFPEARRQWPRHAIECAAWMKKGPLR